MGFFLLKLAVSALLVALVSEVAKRSTLLAAPFAALPLVTFLSMIWIYLETGDTQRVGRLGLEVFWMVLPSLLCLLLVPWLLGRGWNFWLAMAAAIVLATPAYLATYWWLRGHGPA